MKKLLSLFTACLLLLSITPTTLYATTSGTNKVDLQTENGVAVFHNLQWGMSIQEVQALVDVKHIVTKGETHGLLTANSVTGLYVIK